MVNGLNDKSTPSGGKLLGACSQIAAQSGANVTVLRVCAVIAALCWFKLTIALYCATAIWARLERR